MISDEIRKVIAESGKTHYRIGKDCEIDIRTIDRFMNEDANIVSDSIDRLCEYFGLELRRKNGRTSVKQAGSKRAATKKKPAKKKSAARKK